MEFMVCLPSLTRSLATGERTASEPRGIRARRPPGAGRRTRTASPGPGTTTVRPGSWSIRSRGASHDDSSPWTP